MIRLLLSLSIITAGLMTGYCIRLVARRYRPRADLASLRRALQVIALLGLNPIATFSAIWAFELDNLRIALLPALGVLTLALGGLAGILMGRAQRLSRTQAGAYFCASGMFNIGSIGGLLVFLFLGEAGFALVPFFRLFEEFSYYAFFFPIAKNHGDGEAGADGRSRLATIVRDPFILVAVTSILLGFTLNLTGVSRPALFSRVNSVVIPAGSFLLLASIGIAMEFRRIRKYLRPAMLVALTKFVFVPSVVVSAAALLGLGRFDDGLALKVVLILSSTPVAFLALVPPALYKLDLDLANSAWIVTTALLAVVVPLQMVVIRLLG